MYVSVSELMIRIAVVTPPNRFDVMTAPKVRQQLEALLADGVSQLVVDLTAVTFCDSAAIAVLVRALKQARQQNGSVRLVWPQAEMARRIFTLTKFDQVFAMAETAAAALRPFQGVS